MNLTIKIIQENSIFSFEFADFKVSTMKKIKFFMLILSLCLFSNLKICTQDIIFDHEFCTDGDSSGCWEEKKIEKRPGEIISIQIENTYPDNFNYNLEGFKIPDADGNAESLGRKETHFINEVYDPQYGGYILRITPKSSVPTGLGAVTIVITVEEKKNFNEEWIYSVDGGYSITNLTDPKYYLANKTITETVTSINNLGEETTEEIEESILVIRENTEGRSKIQHSLASLVNFGHKKLDVLRGTVGMGLRQDGELSLFMGLGLELGAVSIIGGRVYGPIARLPDGANLDDPMVIDRSNEVTDVNILNNSQNLYKGGWFFGFSLKLVNPSLDAFTKPFNDPQPQVRIASNTRTPEVGDGVDDIDKAEIELIDISPSGADDNLDVDVLYTLIFAVNSPFTKGDDVIVKSTNFKITPFDENSTSVNEQEVLTKLDDNFQFKFKLQTEESGSTTKISIKRQSDAAESKEYTFKVR